MNDTGSYSKIYHFPLNLLPHYLVKFECSAAQLFIHTSMDHNNLHSVNTVGLRL